MVLLDQQERQALLVRLALWGLWVQQDRSEHLGLLDQSVLLAILAAGVPLALRVQRVYEA